MDLKQLQAKLGITDNNKLLRKSQELQRLSRIHFNSSEFGVGEICKAVLCVELACQSYQKRFVAALPEARRASADFNRPVFTTVAFFLCAKKNKLKIDKAELMKLCATTEAEFNHVATSMTDLCFDILGTRKFKRESKSIKTDEDAFPGKTVSSDEESDSDDDASLNDDDRAEIPGFKRSRKALEKESYNQWKDAVVKARDAGSAKRPPSKQKQGQLNFQTVVASTN